MAREPCVWKQIVSFSSSNWRRCHEFPLTQPYTNKQGQGSLNKNMIPLIIYSTWHKQGSFPTEVLSMPFPQSAPQHEGSFVVGLCVGKECDKDFKGLDKSTLSFGEPCNTAERERGCRGCGGQLKKTHPVISSTPEQLFSQLRSSATQVSSDTRVDLRKQMHASKACGQLHSYMKLKQSQLSTIV